MITILKIFGYVIIAFIIAIWAFILLCCDWDKFVYPDKQLASDPFCPYYYKVTLPCRTWQFRNTILHGWYTHIPGLYYNCASGHIYFYVWRDERYL